jgi:predicted nucleotide-binding protein
VADRPYLFVSYARDDISQVTPIVDAMREELEARALPVEVWTDVTHLQPGESWANAIAEALASAIGFVFFVSRRSLESAWIQRELQSAISKPDRLIFPVVLEGHTLPASLMQWQALWLTRRPTKAQIRDAAVQLADATERYLATTPAPAPLISSQESSLIAADIARDIRASEYVPADGPPNSVFVVHGHDEQPLAQLDEYLTSVGVQSVILARRDESPQSLFQKFMTLGGQARFAIVLLSGDDYGASRRQYDAEGVAERALQFRARQNGILELGFFYGHLGWEHVFVVFQGPDRVFPNFERPSDLDGVVFDSLADADWQKRLGQRLTAAGFALAF